MKKRYIIGLSNPSKAKDKLMIKEFKELEINWWHYIPSLWMVVDKHGDYDAEEILNVIQDVYGDVDAMVFELTEDGDGWAGFGPYEPTKNMFKWIEKNW